MSRFYVTTPIYYVNDVPHLGTAYTTIAADALRRYHLLRGDDTWMLTGTDEHGLKLEREAQARGISPAAFVKEMSDRFEAAWPKLEIGNDDFIRTTQERHEKLVQGLWTHIQDKGDIYLGAYEGLYCVGCEDFKTEKDLLPGGFCPLHPTMKAELMKEPTYFFKLAKYQDQLLAHIEAHPEFIQPESRRNEVVSFVKSGLKDLSVSRASFTWGIPVPGDPKHVMFVWFDALTNYWSAVQSPDALKRFWSHDSVVHLVGKDIVRQHAVYWPAMLLAAGYELPKTIYAHGFLTFGGQKMSKSLRNAVDPIGLAREFGTVCGGDDAGADVLRYQLLRAIAFGQDGDFDLAAMIERYNADLGKNLGNLLARTLGLCAKMTDGKVPAIGPGGEHEDSLINAVEMNLDDAKGRWNALAPHLALERAFTISSAANVYVDRTAPWTEAKNGNSARVGTILANLLQVLEVLSVILWPVLPQKSQELRRQLGLPRLSPSVGEDQWPTKLRTRAAGEALAIGGSLFPTIDADGAKALLEKLTPKVADEAPAPPPTAPSPELSTATAALQPTSTSITYDHFSTIDLRVGLVLTCDRVPKKDKLLLLSVDLGEATPRTIVAGLALSFKPEDLVGKRVVVVANLTPRDFGKGLVSHGMVLATGPSEALKLATVPESAEPGARLK